MQTISHSLSQAATALVCLALVAATSARAAAQDFGNAEEFAASAAKGKDYSPYAGRAYPTRVFWGDTHLHTALSLDAGMFGNRLGLAPAYRFSRGEEVVSATGLRAKLGRPLDFVVLADHSDGMGFFTMLAEGDPVMMGEELGRRWNKMIKAGGEEAVAATLEVINKFSQGEIPWATNDPSLMRPVWDSVVDAAERFGIEMPADVPMTTQERACTSPIWYSPLQRRR